MDLDRLRALDAADPMARFRDAFALPEGVIYMAGNSLGPPPRAAAARLGEVVSAEWGRELVAAWTRRAWIDAPARVGAKIAPLVGARANEVIAADSTSVNLFKLLAGALAARPERSTVLTVQDDFPTDLYVASGATGLLAGRNVVRAPRAELAGAMGADVAAALTATMSWTSATARAWSRSTSTARGRTWRWAAATST